jgi:hypothetical protein
VACIFENKVARRKPWQVNGIPAFHQRKAEERLDSEKLRCTGPQNTGMICKP